MSVYALPAASNRELPRLSSINTIWRDITDCNNSGALIDRFGADIGRGSENSSLVFASMGHMTDKEVY